MERAPVLVRQGGQQVLRQLPPGFRFHPTDEELVVQYLRRKAFALPLPAAVIPDLHHLYALDPWDIPGAAQGDRYFFAVRPPARAKRGGRCATPTGCWKPAAGRDKPVVVASRHLVGVKKSMVFVPRRRRGKGKGKVPSPSPAPQTTDWAMHEYRLALPPHHKNGCCLAEAGSEEWVVCRIFQRDSRPSRNRQTPGGHATAAHRTMPMPMPPSLSSASSSSSCVTSSSDQEEVSS